jgi:glucose/arabinose dehydrogenase/PIN domain nuclease of toxin-antitoxin system
MNKIVFIISFLILFTFNFTVKAQVNKVEPVFSERFENPVGMEYSHKGSRLLYIVRKTGFVDVKNLNNSEAASTNFIDISDRIGNPFGEMGLLGLAFSPNYPEDETFYLYYTFKESGGDRNYYSTLARYKAPGGVADPDSEERLFELLQPQDNHNGGQIVFGPDGYLYIALGDGGRDSRELAQNTKVLNGSILRIDVSSETGYEIPPDNPFVGDPDGLDEIYAWGLRNPWRISFDPGTGNLWAADVGEKDRESIYIIDKGKNYGWPIIEGSVCVPVQSECDKTGLELPVYEFRYDNSIGKSITGGYIYRGRDNPSLYGKYIYGDFISGRIWALEIDPDTREVISNEQLMDSDLMIPSFGVDSSGELYVLEWGADAEIYRFTPELTLTELALKSVNGSSAIKLTWDVNSESDIDSFELYKGVSMDDLELFDTAAGDSREFTDQKLLDGATFYSVRAVQSGGDQGELSNPVSYYNATVTISDTWQLHSLPYETNGLSIPNVDAYRFDGSYQLEDQLRPGYGYWIRSSVEGGVEYSAKGTGVQSSTLQLNPGWNLVGSVVGEMPVEYIEDADGILNSTPIYRLNGPSYEETDILKPGQGYWVYSDEGGEVVLDLEALSASLPLKSVVSKEDDVLYNAGNFDIIEFNSGGVSAEFFATEHAVSRDVANLFRMPPVAPSPILDVRTSRGFRLAESDRFEPQVTLSDYPLTIRFASAAEKNQVLGSEMFGTVTVYELTLFSEGVTEKIELAEGESHVISEPYDRMEFQRIEIKDEMVKQTELLPSYPNPFNPVTTISYRLSQQQQVNLTVYDAAGRRIATLVDGEQGAGRYTLPFDASGFASGIYFVRFSAGDVLSTQKLTLIK